MPALQTLDLISCLPRRSGHSIHGSIIDLPYLKALYLEYNHATRCLDFLNHIRIPSSCNLRLCCDERRPQWISEIGSLFHAHANREHGPIRSLSLNFRGSEFDFHVSRRQDGEENDIKHILECQPIPQYSLPDSSDFIVDWCHRFPVENIHHLHVELRPSQSDWIPQRWINAFGRCSAVDVAELYGDQSQTLAFCKALIARIPQDDPCKEAPFLPNVTCLILHLVSFYGANQREKLSFQKAFLKQLGMRQKVKAIQTICIKSSNLEGSEQFIAELGKIVPEVQWDNTSRRCLIEGSDLNPSDDPNHGFNSNSSDGSNGDFSDGDFHSDEN